MVRFTVRVRLKLILTRFTSGVYIQLYVQKTYTDENNAQKQMYFVDILIDKRQ